MKLKNISRAFASAALLLACILATGGSSNAQTPPLKLVATTDLPGISGDFDHLAIDRSGHRLFLVAEDHKTLEVLDTETHKHIKTVTGFGTPHSVFYLPESGRILVTDGEKGDLVVLDGKDYSVIQKVGKLAGADSARIDSTKKVMYLVTGGKDVEMDHSFLVAIDLTNMQKLGELRIESNHVEALALEEGSPRLFLNITDKAQVAVIDRVAMKELTRWPMPVATENSPMAYDQVSHRIFIVCRKPPTLVVLDSTSGKLVASLPVAARSDDIAYDAAGGRIYIPGGDGHVTVVQQSSPDKYSLVANVPSATGGKTSLLSPELKRFYVAVSPGESKSMAKLLTFETEK